ncbi:MAG: HyaD/HybD family hydrogenase maturation endopeptidase [Steroidobacteraceae bacterium]
MQHHTQDNTPDSGSPALPAPRTDESGVLVLGFGNVLLGDDGAGVRLVERLCRNLGPGAAQFVDGGTLSFSLLSHVGAADSMLLIDAANLHRPAGTVEVFEGAVMDEFLLSTRRRSVHEVGLIDLLDTARLLGCLPPRRALLCIQPLRIDWCDALSAPVDAAFPGALERAKAILDAWKLP